MKKRIVIRIIILILAVIMACSSIAGLKRTSASAADTVTGTVSRIDYYPWIGIDDDDSWSIYADYVYNGKTFSGIYVDSTSSASKYKVGDQIKIHVNSEGEFLDKTINNYSAKIALAVAVIVFSFALPALRRRRDERH